MKIVSGRTGSPHVTSQQFRQMLEGIIGQGSYIITSGENLKPELSSNNLMKIRSGMMAHHGCISCVDIGTYDEVTLTNGSQGMKRIDLIVNRYTRNAETEVEKCSWKVIQGTPVASNPAVPAYTSGNLQDGDLVDDCPAFEVHYDGINVTEVKSLLSVTDGLSELSSKLTKANNDITAMNNIIKNVEIKKTNLKVAANSDFRWCWDLPTISGYYPLEVLAWNFHGDYDLWLNVSTAARYSTSNQFGIEGHNFGNGTATVTLFVHILYVKNGFCSYVKA